MKRLYEHGLKLENDFVDSLPQVSGCPDDWFSYDDIRFVERYIKGDVHLFVLFRLANQEGLADFKCLSKVGDGEGRSLESCLPPERFVDRDFDTPNLDEGGEQRMVLVGNIEFIERPEQGPLPMLVRLGAPDQILRGFRHALYFSFKRGFVDFVTAKNGIHGFIRDGSTTHFNQLASEMIKRTPEVVNDVASHEGQRGVDFTESGWEISMKALVSRFRIRLGADVVWLRLDKPIPDDFEILDVCVGPFNFSADERESFISG